MNLQREVENVVETKGVSPQGFSSIVTTKWKRFFSGFPYDAVAYLSTKVTCPV